jgi:hypothetical protein
VSVSRALLRDAGPAALTYQVRQLKRVLESLSYVDSSRQRARILSGQPGVSCQSSLQLDNSAGRLDVTGVDCRVLPRRYRLLAQPSGDQRLATSKLRASSDGADKVNSADFLLLSEVGMASLEDKLAGWTGPSSATEQDKQDRTERMVKEAVRDHPGLKDCTLTVYTKGSYPNNTNVKADSDVDVAVQCSDVFYWDAAEPGAESSAITPYTGMWTPSKLRAEVLLALESKFPGQIDASGSTAIKVNSSTARVDADVLPCFDYRYYFSTGGYREGSRAFKTDGGAITNYPGHQLANGISKNQATATRFKKAVRVLKRIENAMVQDSLIDELPSYFMECLVYNVPNSILTRTTWVEVVRGVLGHVYENLEGPEPDEESLRWLEVNECKYLFHSSQKWSRSDGRKLTQSAWDYLGYPDPA